MLRRARTLMVRLRRTAAVNGGGGNGGGANGNADGFRS
jgi:hypothetical protein